MANKLELTWVGKDEPIRIEPRLLIERPELSNIAADPGTDNIGAAFEHYDDNLEHSLWRGQPALYGVQGGLDGKLCAANAGHAV